MLVRSVLKTTVMLSMMASAPIYSAAAAPVRASQSLPSATTVDARAGAELEAESQMGGGFLIPLLALAAIVLGILVVLDEDDDSPTSP
jgi:hypothetical protein